MKRVCLMLVAATALIACGTESKPGTKTIENGLIESADLVRQMDAHRAERLIDRGAITVVPRLREDMSIPSTERMVESAAEAANMEKARLEKLHENVAEIQIPALTEGESTSLRPSLFKQPYGAKAGCGTMCASDFCSTTCLCANGEGDCDSDAECENGYCAADIGAQFGCAAEVDICQPFPGCHTSRPGSPTFCSQSCPCDAGEGDCDSDLECATGTYCRADVGATYGWAAEIDVCEALPGCHTSSPGSPTFCSSTCLCEAGEGDCDSDLECAMGTYCRADVGANYGWAADIDVCEAFSGCHTSGPGSPTYCSQTCPCNAGEGDCDSDAECANGNYCRLDVGANYGWSADIDVCEAWLGCHTSGIGTPTYCSQTCPCLAGEGDCDSDAECVPGTYCHMDVGANYGWSSNTDVCESLVANYSSLFFSEYIEGSSSNKALEIYNAGLLSLDLSACSVRLYSNGASSPSASVTLSGSLPAGGIFILCHPLAMPGIISVCQLQSSAVVNYNGDDAVTLYCDGATRDVIGQVGFDPGSEWTGGGVSTLNRTLCRKPTIITGDSDGNDPFDPSVEWLGYPQDNIAGLGSRNCP